MARTEKWHRFKGEEGSPVQIGCLSDLRKKCQRNCVSQDFHKRMETRAQLTSTWLRVHGALLHEAHGASAMGLVPGSGCVDGQEKHSSVSCTLSPKSVLSGHTSYDFLSHIVQFTHRGWVNESPGQVLLVDGRLAKGNTSAQSSTKFFIAPGSLVS